MASTVESAPTGHRGSVAPSDVPPEFERECVGFFAEVVQVLGIVPEYKPQLTTV